MNAPRRAATAGIAGVLALGGAAVANELGMFADDAARHLPRPRIPVPDPIPTVRIPVPDPIPTVRIPDFPTPTPTAIPGRVPTLAPIPDTGPPPGLVDALTDPRVPTAVKDAIAKVRGMSRGSDNEKAVASATCKVLSAAAENEPEHAQFEALILAQVEPGSLAEELFRETYAEDVANALTIAHANARAGLWYVQYCLRP